MASTATRTENKGSSTTASDKTPRARREPVAIHDRMKNQLTTAALKGKIKAEELESLENHIGKLKGLIEA